jgi:hypothetical protein
MRRVLVAIVLLAAGTGGGWWMWSRVPQVSSSSQTVPPQGRFATPTKLPEPVLPPADLTLQVNGDTTARVRSGESVVFTITLQGTKSQPAFRVGAPGKPWSTQLRLETADGKATPWAVEQLGGPDRYYFDRKQPGVPQSDSAEEAIADTAHIYQIDFGINPVEAARLSVGTQRLRAVLSLPQQPTPIISNIVVITIHAAAGPDDDLLRLQSAARFYLRTAKWEDAHRLALQLVGRPKPDVTAYALLGDALNGLGRDREALAAYHEAMGALPKDFSESPDYLIARMNEVLDRLEKEPQRK